MELGDKRVLVTGAGGFIGSHLTEKLVELGADVRAFVRYTSDGRLGNIEEFSNETLKKIELVRGDLKNPDGVERAVADMDVVFHLAASISIPYSYVDPRTFVETNVTGTLNVLKAAQEFGMEKIIITSTSEVYGTALYTPIDEKHPLQPQSPYAASKVGADKLAESFYKAYDLPVTIIRPFNAFGPRQSIRAVIPTIIAQALTKDKIKLGSLSPKRDFTYVRDTADSFIKIAESDASTGEVVNVGSGQAVSIRDVVRVVGDILGEDLESKVETEEKRVRPEKSEVMLLLCDNSKARDLLSWQPKVSLEQGLRETVDYIRQNISKYRVGEYGI
jgi:NAD dependent epimerase/dehydratase